MPQPRTTYQAVRKLPAAHTLTIEKGKVGEPRPYWDLSFSDRISNDDLSTELRSRLRAAVSSHMISDVPIGI